MKKKLIEDFAMTFLDSIDLLYKVNTFNRSEPDETLFI